MFAGVDIDTDSGIETLRFTGSLTVGDIGAAFASIADRLGPDTRRLWDFRGVDITLQAAELQALGTRARERDHPGARAALVADGDLAFALCRQHLAYRESEQVEVAVFRTMEEALAFLGKS